ncbi:MAG TPA: Nif3-like dinuclear metal center hexameric protein [Fimbriimonas sp.]|nr:Nif3-like dinuclear metal center hexameric protein [Fimbriimonas sp.]
MTVADLLATIEEIAPRRCAMKSDNIGLLYGDTAAEVTGIAFALDLTHDLINFASEQGANVLLTHHPILWQPTRSVTADFHEGRLMLAMARANLNHVASHTNWDAAPGGINDTLAGLLGLQDVKNFGSFEPCDSPQPYGRVGCLPAPISLLEFQKQLDQALDVRSMAYGDPSSKIHRVAVVGGAADGEFAAALEVDADVFVTGEVRHHTSLQAGCIIAAGHFATENPGMKAMKEVIEKAHPSTPCHFFEPRKGHSGRPL